MVLPPNDRYAGDVTMKEAIDTLVQLKSRITTTINDNVLVNCDLGVFYFDSASTSTPNDVTVVQPDDQAGAGRWIRLYFQRVTTVAAADPTATDDYAQGYSVGETWVNSSTQEIFTCVDNTATAAVWLRHSTSGTSKWTVIDQGSSDFGIIPADTTHDVLVDTTTGKNARFKIKSDIAGTNYYTLTANASPQEKTIGAWHCDYTTVAAALTAIIDAAESKPYTLRLGTQSYGVPTNSEGWVNIDGTYASFTDTINLQENMYATLGYVKVSGTDPALYSYCASALDNSLAAVNHLIGLNQSCVTTNQGHFNFYLHLAQLFATSTSNRGCFGTGTATINNGNLDGICNAAQLSSTATNEAAVVIANGVGEQTLFINNITEIGTGGNNYGVRAYNDSHDLDLMFNKMDLNYRVFDIDGGNNRILFNRASGGADTTIDGSATNYLMGNVHSGNIVIGSGATAYLDINYVGGTITNGGTLYGRAGQTLFNDYTLDDGSFSIIERTTNDKTVIFDLANAALPNSKDAVTVTTAKTGGTDIGYLFKVGSAERFAIDPSGNIRQGADTLHTYNGYYKTGTGLRVLQGGVGGGAIIGHDTGNNNIYFALSRPGATGADAPIYKEVSILSTVSSTTVELNHNGSGENNILEFKSGDGGYGEVYFNINGVAADSSIMHQEGSDLTISRPAQSSSYPIFHVDTNNRIVKNMKVGRQTLSGTSYIALDSSAYRHFLLNTASNDTDIHGIANGVGGNSPSVKLIKSSASNKLRINYESTSAAVGNRIRTTTGSDVEIAAGKYCNVSLDYDDNDDYWVASVAQ